LRESKLGPQARHPHHLLQAAGKPPLAAAKPTYSTENSTHRLPAFESQRRHLYDALGPIDSFFPLYRSRKGEGRRVMATGFDEVIDFLLSEIALCGTEGTYRLLLPV
jgi:hypothetical protein